MAIGKQLRLSLDQSLLISDRSYLIQSTQLKQDADDWITRAEKLTFADKDW